MSERNKHLFQFRASEIAKAANREAEYHDSRWTYWGGELENATATVEKTASVSVKRLPHTGGWSPQVTVDYGDAGAYRRMQQAATKIQQHATQRDRFRSDADLYTTQSDRVYDLDGEDVAHFRFNGRQRDE